MRKKQKLKEIIRTSESVIQLLRERQLGLTQKREDSRGDAQLWCGVVWWSPTRDLAREAYSHGHGPLARAASHTRTAFLL